MLESESVGQGDGLGCSDFGCRICEGLVDHLGHAEDFHCIAWTLDGLDGGIEGSKSSADGLNAGLDGLQVTLGDWGGEGCTKEGERDDSAVKHDCGLGLGFFELDCVGEVNVFGQPVSRELLESGDDE